MILYKELFLVSPSTHFHSIPTCLITIYTHQYFRELLFQRHITTPKYSYVYFHTQAVPCGNAIYNYMLMFLCSLTQIEDNEFCQFSQKLTAIKSPK